MYKKFVITSIFSILSIILFVSVSQFTYADAPNVKLIANPNKTEVVIGTKPIALTAQSSGTELKFSWKKLGAGELKGDPTDPMIFYVPPKDMNGDSDQAIVTVTVTDKNGQVATDSIVFSVVSSTPTPTPTPVPLTPKKAETPRIISPVSSEFSLIFSENFDNETKNWETWQTTVESFNDTQQGKCIKISRKNSRSSTWLIGKTFTGYSGTIIIEAMIRSESIQKTPPDGIGKFLIRIVGADGVEDYQGHHFTGDFDWTKKQIEVHDIEKADQIRVQFGLEKTSGTMYVDDVKIFHKP